MDERTGSLLCGHRDKGKRTIRRKWSETGTRPYVTLTRTRSGETRVRPAHYLIRHFGNYGPNVPGQLSARKVGRSPRENRR